MTELPDPRGPTYRLPPPPQPDPTGWYELRRRARSTLWPPRDVAWAGLLAVLVAVAGLYGLWFQATLPGRLPTGTDWRAVATVLARDARPGDAVALAPAWAERAREALPERLPSRPELALPVLALPSYAADAEDLAGFRRIWLVSLPDVPGGAGRAASQLAARSGSVEKALRLGQLELTRFDLASPTLPAWTLAERLASAAMEPGGAIVTRETREVDLLPRSCVVTRWPGARIDPAIIRLPAAPLGGSLRGRAAVIGDATAGAGRATVVIRIDGVELARADAPAGRAAGTPIRIDTARLGPGPHQVTVEVRPSGATSRAFCVELAALP